VCGGKVGLVGPTMLRTVAGSVVCGGEVFAMGSLDELIITTSTAIANSGKGTLYYSCISFNLEAGVFGLFVASYE
jgi:hypothetical protein